MSPVRGMSGGGLRWAVKALICALATVPSLGGALTTASLYPTTYATNSWTTPANAISVNTTYATAAPSKNGSVAGRWDGFNFSSVPAGSTINSVTVSSRYKLSVGTSVATLGVQPWAGGVALGTQAVDASMPTADTTFSSVFTVSEAQLRSADFGVSLTAARANSNVAVTFSLDAVWVVVDYTPPVAPSAPGTPTFTNVAATGLTVNWTASATGNPAPTYTVQQSPNGTGSWTNVSACVGISALTCDVSGLASSTTYWYQVIASNTAGSATSANGSVTTLASAIPPSAPGTPSYSGVTATTLTATWATSSGSAPITYTLQWGSSGSGPWTNVSGCVGISGNSCNASGLQANTTYYYQVVANNSYGSATSASSGVLTAPGQPVMAAYTSVQATSLRVNWTMAGATSGLVYTVQRGAGATGPWTNVAGCVAIASAFCDDSGLTGSTTYWYQVQASNAQGAGAWSSSTSVATAFPAAGEGDNTPGSTRPAVSILNPVSGPVGANFKVQARVFSPGGVAIGAVTLHYNAATVAMTRNTNYGTAGDSGVYEYVFPALAAGSYTLQAEAANASGSVYSRKVTVTIAASAKGDGNLLVRDNSSQLCGDCHTLKSHGSETTSNKYGSWSLACRDCHTPHSTRNLGLVGERITPPARTQEQTPAAVVYRNKNGYGTAGMASPEKDGVCQVCHTQTSVYRSNGTDIDPGTGLPIASGGHNPTGDCTQCHKHSKGLAATCTGCHGTDGRTATVTGADSYLPAAPPALATPAATGAVANGAHLKHVDSATYRGAPLQCDDCHLTKNHRDGKADVAWGALAMSGGIAPTPVSGAVATAGWPTTPTCTNWCHGAALTGGTVPSPAWNGTFASVTCTQCHGGPPPVSSVATQDHPQNTSCDACHGIFANAGYDFAGKSLGAAARGTHVDGTVQKPTKGCASCHGDLSVADGTLVDRLDPRAAPGYGAAAVDTRGNLATTFVGVGAHAKHMTTGAVMSAKACTVCHALPANGDVIHANGATDWSWSAPATSQGVTPGYTQPNCTNYCHSNAKPLGQASATTVSISWTTGTVAGCGGCHKTVAGGATDLSAKHGRHLTYGYSCDECHAATMLNDSSNTVGTVANHVDGAKQVGFSTTFKATAIDQSGGGYTSSVTVPNYTCNSTYCHSNGTTVAAPFGAPAGTVLAWDAGTTAPACDNCHGGNASATYKVATGSHTAHVNQATYLGANVACAQCHDATIGADDRTLDGLTGLVSHVNGQKDVSASGWSAIGKSCSSTYCHSNGTESLVAGDYKSVTWGTTLANDCLGCHGSFSPAAFTAVYGEPNYANNTGNVKTRNSHAKHVSTVLATAKTQCVNCHAGTVDATGVLLSSGGLHVNGARNVQGAGIGAYDEATETCTSVSCHGGGNATWGATLGCGDCHGTAGRVKTIAGAVDANLAGSPPKDAAGLLTGLRVGAHMKHVDSDTYRTNGLLCADCHPATLQHNGTRDAAWSALASAGGAVMSPAAGNGAYSTAWEASPTCTNYCHGNTLNGGTNKTPSWGATGTTCASCHGAPPPVSATAGETHPQNTACASCHGAGYSTAGLSGTAKNTHVNGSIVAGTDKPANGCTACHGVLAGVAGAAVPGTSMTSAPGYNGTGVDTTGQAAVTAPKVGAHDAHVRPAGSLGAVAALDCSNCHGTKPADGTTTHANGTILLGWSTLATGSAMVTPTPSAFNGTWEATPTCTNYCHSNAKPLGQASATVKTATWTSSTNMTCTDCHAGAGAAGGTNLSVAHQKHTDTLANGGYALTCDRCHVASATSNSAIVAGGGQHVNGARNVDFDASGPNNSGGTYSYGVAPAYTCSNTYCHSSGADRTAGYVSGPSAPWNAAAPLACTSCHGYGTTMVSQAHGAHTNQAATYATTYGCQTCHSGTTSNGTTITNTSLHVNFAADVDAGLAYASQSCTTYCHSAGAKLTGGTPPAYFPKAWNTTLSGCSNCHGAYTGVINASKAGEPNYDNGGTSSYLANTHFQHVGDATACVKCHKDVVTAAGTAIANASLHMNGVADITFDASITLTYTPRSGTTAPSCSTVSCHDNPLAPSQWGGTIAEGPCSDCHTQAGAGNGDVDNFVYQTAPRALVDAEDYGTYGHGRTTAFDTAQGLSGNAGPGFTFGGAMTNEGCFYCHTPKVALAAGKEAVPHGQPLNPFRLANTAVGGKTWGKSGNCLVCHATDATGFDPDGTGPLTSRIASAGARVNATHYGSDHGTGGKGGEYCWDCHDPHGDYNYGSAKPIAYMIHEKPVRTHVLVDANGWGVPDPTEFTTNAVEFNAALTGVATVWDGADYTDTGASAPYNGVCQVCHTSASTLYHRADGTGRTHMTGAQCTKCHSHNQAVATDAFKQATACDGCHAASPTASGKHTLHVGAATPAYGSVTPAATAGAYAYNCGKCHSTIATNHYNFNTGGTTTTPYTVEVAFDWASGATPYTLGTASNDTSAVGLVFRTTTGTCATWCHSNAAPAGGTNAWAAPTWDTAAAATICTSCHKMLATTTVPDTNLSHGHYLHTLVSGYAYNCSDCHNGIATGKADYPTTAGTITDRSKHVDGSPSVAFNVTFNPGTPYYNAAPARTCSNTYCHSNGTNAAAPPANTSLAWTGSVATDCTSCHGGNAASGSPLATNEHAEHVNKAAFLGSNFACGRCHAATVSTAADRTIATLANHVNRTAEVSMPEGGTYGGVSTKTCSSTYCHSDGRETPTYKAGLDWDLGTTLADDCEECHGSDASPAFNAVYGEPNYVSNTAADATRNSHQKHLSTTLATAKTQCVDCHAAAINATGTLIAGGTHLNKAVEITTGGKIGSYNAAGETCNNITCHGGGSASWGATLTCLGCHSGTEGGALGDGSGNAVDDEWAIAAGGHGGTAGGSFTSALNGCDYCHDLGSAHTPTVATNPYRLRYSATANTLCLQCHLTGDAGINVNSAGTALTLENSTKNVDAAHDGAEHVAGEGGMFCWDCHDPHGVPTNIRMVKRAVSITANAYGVPLTTGPVNFTSTVCTAAGAGCFVEAAGSPRQGVCQACHSPTGTVSYWRWDGTGNTHNPTNATAICSGCHAHKEKFKGSGGGPDCRSCHGTSVQGTKRAVDADFSKQSHHVGTGGTMGGTLTNNDCWVCHAEYDASLATTGALHANGVIDLRNVDTPASSYPYDKRSMPAGAANWSSANATWRTQTSTNLDPFCLGCHDTNGASGVAAIYETGATAQNPFKDTAITNNYDQMTRPGIIDIKSKQSGNPPAQGTFSRHAIRGQSTSKYTKYTAIGAGFTSMYEAARFTNMGTDELGRPLWNDTSVMGCADCHTSDGANTTVGNAHGSTSEYLLKDASGLASEGMFKTLTNICVRCHTSANYGKTHTGGSGSDFVDSADLVGTARSGGNGTMFGMACINCHGGARGNGTAAGDTNPFGWIHGSNQVFGTGAGGGGGTRNAFRFMNGSALRYYTPGSATWDTAGGTCVTLGTGDALTTCTQHGSGKATGVLLKRPLAY